MTQIIIGQQRIQLVEASRKRERLFAPVHTRTDLVFFEKVYWATMPNHPSDVWICDIEDFIYDADPECLKENYYYYEWELPLTSKEIRYYRSLQKVSVNVLRYLIDDVSLDEAWRLSLNKVLGIPCHEVTGKMIEKIEKDLRAFKL